MKLLITETVLSVFYTNNSYVRMKENSDFTLQLYIHTLLYWCTGSSGYFFHTFFRNETWKHGLKKYSLDVKGVDPNIGDSVIWRGEFRVFGHQEKYFCSLNMINTGSRPIPQGESLEFISVGKAKEFNCTIDEGTPQLCKLLIFAVTTTVSTI